MDEKIRILSTDEELKTFNDPYRMKIIKIYKRYGVPLTVKQCADYMGEVPSKVHYHVKKLLSINILALDHIKVINGINAKYYYLPKKAFTIMLEDKETELIYSQLNEVESLVANIITDFKKDYFASSRSEIETKNQVPSDIGFVSATDIYLSENDFKELNEFFGKLGEKYGNSDENKKRYSILAGLTRIYK